VSPELTQLKQQRGELPNMTTEYKPGDRVVCLNLRTLDYFGRGGTVIEPQEIHHTMCEVAGAPIVALVEMDKFFPEQQLKERVLFKNPEHLAPEKAQDIIAARIYKILDDPNLAGHVNKDILREAAEKGVDVLWKPRNRQVA
jgi:hypothetical protein